MTEFSIVLGKGDIMKCRRIEKLIPLYVGGDLESSKAQELVLHVKSCNQCARLVAEYRESQEWVRSYTPPRFDGALFDDLKESVLKEIQMKKPLSGPFHLFSGRFNPVVAAAIAVLAVSAGLALYVHFNRSWVNQSHENLKGEDRPTEGQKAVTPQGNQDKGTWRSTPPRRRVEPSRSRYAKVKTPKRARESAIIEPPMVSQVTDVFNPKRNREEGDYERRDHEISWGAPFWESYPIEPTYPEMLRFAESAGTPEGVTRIEIQTSDPAIRIIWFAPKTGSSSKPVSETE